MATENKLVTFRNILGQSDDLIQEKRAERMCTVAKSDFEAVIANRTKSLFKLEDELESMSDISASNSNLSKNAIEPTQFNSEKYVNRRCELLIKIEVERAELEILKKDAPFYA